ncbi:MAG: hypothetical protein ACJ8G7_06450, partial [Rhizobacter sp.]
RTQGVHWEPQGMTLTSLQALTWGTVTGAVVSALMLASGESSWPDLSRLRRDEAGSLVKPQPPADGKAPAAAPAEQRPAGDRSTGR